MSTRKLVVTGAYGFVGTHLLIAAAQGGYDLVVLDDLSICDGRYLQQIPHRLVKGDSVMKASSPRRWRGPKPSSTWRHTRVSWILSRIRHMIAM